MEDPNTHGPQSPSAGSTASAGASSLPQRPASVVVHGRNVEVTGEPTQKEDGTGTTGLVRKDSLEKTKEFYGLHPSASSSTAKDNGSLRRDRLQRQRSDSRISGTTRGSTYTRPTSPDTGSITSARRSMTILPTPRAFLTPKKPQAAMRMEQIEREKARQSHHGTPSIQSPRTSDQASPASATSSHTRDFSPIPPLGPPVSQSGPSLRSLGSNAITGLTSQKPEYNTLGRIEEAKYSRVDTSLRPSLAETSTPPHIHRELSSDDLVEGASERLPKAEGRFPSSALSPRASRRRTWDSAHGPTRIPPAAARVRRYNKIGNPQITFCLGGHLVTGGDNPFSAIATAVIILGLTGVWLGTTGVWLWKHGSEYGLGRGGGVAIVIVFVYIFGLVLSSALVSAFRDPGIIPRNLDPEPPVTQFDGYYEPDNREVAINNRAVPVKYCETCNSYRPPRASHCRVCGNCVDGIDHHCSYIHTCVGKRNYLSFLVLLISALIGDIYIVIFSAIHFALLCHHDHISFGSALRNSPGAAVSFLLGILAIPPVSFLLWYHARLTLYNLTTVEQIRASASRNLFSVGKRPDNPFASDSIVSNIIIASLGRPQFPSWIDPSGWHEEDKRTVNPALTDPRWLAEGGLKSRFG
ncbi:DHHC palmitoyltransferase-domain-containing protein [Kockovaella imperatae]|uniref:Palmitoyltransferase n=1 Tax=Kockovaella imperatae TaxID=4999 RepID=A0A1Y1UF81_9TREE|nr:DHHC palmitoyltransferase-domain-containing protein [Kockovaella imperatae]ORX36649.1 DHHC palmitoyltransferase-domain-containing protein [Kockovaella imperatae]